MSGRELEDQGDVEGFEGLVRDLEDQGGILRI